MIYMKQFGFEFNFGKIKMNNLIPVTIPVDDLKAQSVVMRLECALK